jgi:hypothetical protein
MVSAESDEGFRITDRRRRDEDDVPTTSAPPKAETARPESARPPQAPPAAETTPPGVGERSLAGLFVMLAGSAAMAMGEAPDPMTGEVHRDLDQAADLIDLLILLREKTEGNRTPEETQILDEILYDLQVRYVSATKRSAPPRGLSRP